MCAARVGEAFRAARGAPCPTRRQGLGCSERGGRPRPPGGSAGRDRPGKCVRARRRFASTIERAQRHLRHARTRTLSSWPADRATAATEAAPEARKAGTPPAAEMALCGGGRGGEGGASEGARNMILCDDSILCALSICRADAIPYIVWYHHRCQRTQDRMGWAAGQRATERSLDSVWQKSTRKLILQVFEIASKLRFVLLGEILPRRGATASMLAPIRTRCHARWRTALGARGARARERARPESVAHLGDHDEGSETPIDTSDETPHGDVQVLLGPRRPAGLRVKARGRGGGRDGFADQQRRTYVTCKREPCAYKDTHLGIRSFASIPRLLSRSFRRGFWRIGTASVFVPHKHVLVRIHAGGSRYGQK